MVVLTLTACYRASLYDGDGQLTDAGWLVVEGHRFRLDLGPVDLATPGSHSFRLSNLPSAEFCAGVEISHFEPIQENDTHLKHTSYVRLELKRSDGALAVLEEGPLSAWVWSHALQSSNAFLYRRGESRDVPIGNGATRAEPLGLKAAGGWGTYFTPERSERYVLTFQVIDPRSTVKTNARLVLHSV
jgi:hypothetical protein